MDGKIYAKFIKFIFVSPAIFLHCTHNITISLSVGDFHVILHVGTLTRTGTLALGSVSSRRTGRLKKKPVSYILYVIV